VPLLYRWSPLALVFLISAIACAAGVFLLPARHGPGLRAQLTIAIIAAAGLFLVNDSAGILKVRAIKSYRRASLQAPEGDLVLEKWSPISRVAVFRPEGRAHSETITVTNDAGAPTLLYRFDGNYAGLGWIRADCRQVVNLLKHGADSLIIGSGGGYDTLAALAFGQKSVTAVEINRVIADLTTGPYAGYIGGIMADPRVRLIVQEGRNFVAASPRRFDIIQITMIDTWSGASAGAYIFNENSLYTKEAIRDYQAHLRPGGILSVTRYYRFDEALRLTNLIVDSLEDAGVRDIQDRVAVVVEQRRGFPWATVLLKNGPFTPGETATILETARKAGYGVVYAPGAPEGTLEPSAYAGIFRALIAPGRYGDRSRAELVDAYPKDIGASTDDRPFFFFMTRLRDTFHVDSREHTARRLAMPILYGMASFLAMMGLVSILAPLALSRRADLRGVHGRSQSLAYFSALGAGFMLIEISLIQRLTIFLGHPSYSFVVVLAGLLFSSGLGSLASDAWNPAGSRRKLLGVLGAILILGLAVVVPMYDQFISLMWLDRFRRILLAVAVIFPMGFLLGMCFPMGIRIARAFHEHLVPWGWGVNGVFSVFASVLSLVIALNFGLKAALLIGLGCYAAAFLVILSLSPAPAVSTAEGRAAPP